MNEASDCVVTVLRVYYLDAVEPVAFIILFTK